MRSILSIATIAGAALFVTACGGGAANNTANAPADNGTAMGNVDTMAPAMNEGMPAEMNSTTNTTSTTTAPGGNTTTTTSTTNTANAM